MARNLRSQIIDIKGERFGELTVIDMADKSLWRNRSVSWICQCDCGKETVVMSYSLRKGITRSCGHGIAIFRPTHGHSRRKDSPATKEYYSWSSMKQRCLNPNHVAYHRYGGRGITICDRWFDFANFLMDMGERPEGTSLDRIDNDGNYEPSNCRWATAKEQRANQ